jgi:8-oxo-dGTP diphosphatase
VRLDGDHGPLPLCDFVGNALVDFRYADESELEILDDRTRMPLSLIVVTLTDTVLMVLNGQRGLWELPGGMRERGETTRQAAARELAEETGIWTTDLDFAAVVEFDLRRPARRKYAAVYRAELHLGPRLVVNEEVSDFRWWDPHSSLSEDMSPLDAEIGGRVIERLTR